MASVSKSMREEDGQGIEKERKADRVIKGREK